MASEYPTIKTMSQVKDVIETESFEYAMTYYSDYEGIEDPKFHELLDKYRAAAKELEEYIEKYE